MKPRLKSKYYYINDNRVFSGKLVGKLTYENRMEYILDTGKERVKVKEDNIFKSEEEAQWETL